jgi:hypothetical protein
MVTTPAANPSGVFSRGSRTDTRPSNTKNFMNRTTTSYHLAYRKCRAQGMGRIEALKASQRSNWNDYVSFCRQQEDGVVMESLDMSPEKEQRNLAVIMSGGRLI